MSLKEKLLEAMKTAMRDKDVLKKNAIQMARSAVLQVEKDTKVTLDDDGVVEVIAKEVKKRRDSIQEYEKAGRQDVIDNLQKEIDSLTIYLPEQLTEEELEDIVKQTVQELSVTSSKEIGKVMQGIMPKVKGRADGRIVNQIVKKILI